MRESDKITIKDTIDRIDKAMGRKKADLVIKNFHVFNVYT